METNE